MLIRTQERERVEQEEYEKSVEFDRIKKAKISALRKKGVPERFLVDLGNFEL